MFHRIFEQEKKENLKRKKQEDGIEEDEEILFTKSKLSTDKQKTKTYINTQEEIVSCKINAVINFKIQAQFRQHLPQDLLLYTDRMTHIDPEKRLSWSELKEFTQKFNPTCMQAPCLL